MQVSIVELDHEYLDQLLRGTSFNAVELHRAYFSPGSSALCLVADDEPVFAGGIVNLAWKRGEAWILPTPFFKRNIKVCLRALDEYLPKMAKGHFVRVQATCIKGISARIFQHLGFEYEGTMKKFGPNGETCDMYARVFEEQI